MIDIITKPKYGKAVQWNPGITQPFPDNPIIIVHQHGPTQYALHVNGKAMAIQPGQWITQVGDQLSIMSPAAFDAAFTQITIIDG